VIEFYSMTSKRQRVEGGKESKESADSDAFVAVVTGASRGLGLGLVTGLLARDNVRVYAGARNPEKAKELNALKAKHGDKLTLLQLDVTDEKSIKTAAEQFAKSSNHLDLLINNAGISAPTHPSDPVLTATKKVMLDVYSTNVVGPLLVTQSLYPALQASYKLRGKKNAPRVVNMSSNLGAIGGNFGDYSSYRCSKAALNMLTTTFAAECKDCIFLAMSPGWVKTDMGRAEAPLTVKESVDGMLLVIDALSLKDSGTFRGHDGEKLSW